MRTLALPAAHCGHLCAIAGEGERDLQDCVTVYSGLYPVDTFDPALLATVALANTFCAPWLAANRLRITNRASLWAFGVDRMLDHVAASASEVADIVARCVAVADGAAAPPGDPLTGFLAEIRDELAKAPASGHLQPLWCAELRRMLEAMALEWQWQSAKTTPTLDEYLDNADNLGFAFVYVSHWASTAGAQPPSDVDELLAAGRAAQRVIRLLNDLGTYERDVKWGDLNALMLGVSRADVWRLAAELARACRGALLPLATAHPLLTGYLERQMGFNAGFYRLTDYWGAP